MGVADFATLDGVGGAGLGSDASTVTAGFAASRAVFNIVPD